VDFHDATMQAFSGFDSIFGAFKVPKQGKGYAIFSDKDQAIAASKITNIGLFMGQNVVLALASASVASIENRPTVGYKN
jgi:hypothetical protein